MVRYMIQGEYDHKTLTFNNIYAFSWCLFDKERYNVGIYVDPLLLWINFNPSMDK